MSGKIEATFILEIIGRPAEHMLESLNDIIDNKLTQEKGIKIINKKIGEAVLIENKKDFYSSFAEIDAEFDSLDQVLLVLFKYYPSNIEIVRPEKITMENVEINTLFNEISRRIHGYEEITRVLQIERAKLEKKLKESTSS